MKKGVKDKGWSVHYSHVRPEFPHRWTRHGALESEQAAIDVACLLHSQGMIVFAIHEGDDRRWGEHALRDWLTGAADTRIFGSADVRENGMNGSAAPGHVEREVLG